MSDILQLEDKYYILATSPLADTQTRVLKHGETFAIYDEQGDVLPFGLGEQGVYHEGTRFLSSLRLVVDGKRPLLLSSTVIDTNDLLTVDLTNPDLRMAMGSPDEAGARIDLPHGALHLFRSRFLRNGMVYERLRVTSYADHQVRLEVAVNFAADFIDIFEVRGIERERRGRILDPVVEDTGVTLGYRGLDHVVRRTRLRFSPPPQELHSDHVRYELSLAPCESREMYITLSCEVDRICAGVLSYEEAYAESEHGHHRFKEATCQVFTSNEQFEAWIDRSLSDLYMLVSDTEHGPYPYAGVPWYSTVFGRDGIITALELSWVQPEIARGVLRHLAATQATSFNPERDAEPGKILHEKRNDEMAVLQEIPFDRYYGTVDATPLFIMLAGAYFRRTGDREALEEVWPHVERALAWLDTHGDLDGDGFVEYSRRSATGLANQGWKDSWDSVFHDSGALAEAPIALCEVQGYAYAARRAAAALAEARGDLALAGRLRARAEELRVRFEAAFWCDRIGTYALALDGAKRACCVRTSNPGHCLYTGIAAPARAAVVARTLMSEDMFSGWGVRTVASTERRYNPMAYHNGSVWPHDNALLAAGLGAYGHKDAACRIVEGLFAASTFFELHRTPELLCGFPRRRGARPTLFPLACSPQAWSAAAVFLLIESMLGLSIDAPRGAVRFTSPMLPPFLDWVELRNLRVGAARLDLRAERYPNDVSIRVMGRDGEVEVTICK